MKVILVSQFYKPEMGAPQNRLMEMVLGLKKRGADLSVVTALPNYPEGKIFPAYRKKLWITEILDDILVKRFSLFASNSRKKLPRIFSMLSFSISVLFSIPFCIRQKPDIIIVESPPLTLAFSALVISKICGAKLVVNVSDLWPLSALELKVISKGKLYRFLEWCEKFIYKRADACLGQSQEIVDYISERKHKKLMLFRNGVDMRRFSNNHSNNKPNGNTKKLVYAGLLGVAQGINQICREIDFSNLGVEFCVYGAGPEKESIIEYLKAHTDKGIKYMGSVKREQIPETLALYDAALIPLVSNIYGAVPSKIYEAMASGLPILFSGEGEGARIIRDNKIGWVSPSKDIAMLEKNINELNNADCGEISKRCIQLAETSFNRNKQIDKLYDFLRHI